MTFRLHTVLTTLGLIAAIACGTQALAQSERAASPSSTCGTACSEAQMRSTAASSSRSLQASPEDLSSLSSASKSSDTEQLRAILQKHGFSAAQLEGTEIVVKEIRSPRDSASGQASGKRQHSAVTSPDGGTGTGATDAAASRVTVTITVKLKPPTIIITIRW